MASDFMMAEEFDFEAHREARSMYSWGSFGKRQDQDETINPIEGLTTNHIYNILRTQNLSGGWRMLFITELCYRSEYGKESGGRDCLNGLWATDKPELLQDHPRKDLFFRVGYPKEEL
mgnify:CR=1 FL=1|tara:strand:- start:58 stop:411 length:354 start_codon:yes stop_codon:yes gene_type:complete